MEKNSLSCSRVSARLVVHQIAELQLTALLQKRATKFYNQAPIFPEISSGFALKLVSGSGSFSRYCVLVLQWRSPYNSSNRAQQPSTKNCVGGVRPPLRLARHLCSNTPVVYRPILYCPPLIVLSLNIVQLSSCKKVFSS